MSEDSKVHQASDIASEAARIVGGARAATHGDKRSNHAKIADVWNGILKAAGKAPATALDAHDVANLMEGMKIARRYLGEFNVDDYVDGAGYAACAGEIKSAEVEALRAATTWAKAASDGLAAAIAGHGQPTDRDGWIDTKKVGRKASLKRRALPP